MAIENEVTEIESRVSYLRVNPKSWSDYDDDRYLLSSEELYTVYEKLGFDLVDPHADRSISGHEMRKYL